MFGVQVITRALKRDEHARRQLSQRSCWVGSHDVVAFKNLLSFVCCIVPFWLSSRCYGTTADDQESCIFVYWSSLPMPPYQKCAVNVYGLVSGHLALCCFFPTSQLPSLSLLTLLLSSIVYASFSAFICVPSSAREYLSVVAARRVVQGNGHCPGRDRIARRSQIVHRQGQQKVSCTLEEVVDGLSVRLLCGVMHQVSTILSWKVFAMTLSHLSDIGRP